MLFVSFSFPLGSQHECSFLQNISFSILHKEYNNVHMFAWKPVISLIVLYIRHIHVNLISLFKDH